MIGTESLQVKYQGKVYTFVYHNDHQGKEHQIRNSDDQLLVSVIHPTKTFAEFVGEELPEIMVHGL